MNSLLLITLCNLLLYMAGVYDGNHSLSTSSNQVIKNETNGWNMQGHKIINVKDPSEISDKQNAVTVNFGDIHYILKKTTN